MKSTAVALVALGLFGMLGYLAVIGIQQFGLLGWTAVLCLIGLVSLYLPVFQDAGREVWNLIKRPGIRPNLPFWWCQTHDASGLEPEFTDRCWRYEFDIDDRSPCRLMEVCLAPVNR